MYNSIHAVQDLLKNILIIERPCKNRFENILPVLLLKVFVQPRFRGAQAAPHSISHPKELVNQVRADITIGPGDENLGPRRQGVRVRGHFEFVGRESDMGELER